MIAADCKSLPRTFLSRAALAATAALAAALTGIFPPHALAQSDAAQARTSKPLAFEVVSIRSAPFSTRGPEDIAVTPNGWHMAHSPLITALLSAYTPTRDAMMYTVSTLVGIPDWMQTELYTIDAKVSESDVAAWQNPANQPAMLRAMMQAMLADRCKLAVHRGTKEVSVYLLVAGKGGPKLKASLPGEPHPGAVPIPGGGYFLSSDGAGNASFYAAPVSGLDVMLSNLAGRPVVDKTGLTGRYDMTFRRPHPGAPSAEAEPNPPPTIFEVVESFGLKLEPSKTSVETLVIDHVEKPSEN
jgi:bla regulator protein BlaR1